MRRCLNCMEEYPDKNQNTCPHCGFTEGEQKEEEYCFRSGGILQKRYIVGNMIKVREQDIFYIGWDALFERKVQIQEYFPKDLAERKDGNQVKAKDGETEGYQSGLEIFYIRSRELLRLYKEADIITYDAVFKENGTAYAVMDHLDYETIGRWLKGGAMPADFAAELFRDAARAVDKVHQLGLYHGMLGADTFWLGALDKPVLKDFGCWPDSGEENALEKGKGLLPGIRKDICGLAKLFCRMMTGQEIQDPAMLEEVFSRSKVRIGKTAVSALKKAMSGETDSVEQFIAELRVEDEAEDKESGIPPWALVLGGVLAAGIIVAFIVIFIR